MTWNDGLKGTSLDIASSTSNRLLVVAGPGTGKSYVMKRRILKLIEEENIEPKRILALTFTRTIAGDLKKELHNLGIENAKSIKAMTLHAFCFSLLNEKRVFECLRRVPRPLKSFTSKGSPQFELSPLLADLDLLGDFGTKREKFKWIKAFEAAWAREQSDTPNNDSGSDTEFENILTKWLETHNAILLGELIPLTLKYLTNNPADDIFNDFSYIVVDEYQDLNKAEQTLIDQLGTNCKISVAGDADQSIYSFRYAHPNGIEDFANRHDEKCEQFAIEYCRRCSKNIVSAANSLIVKNYQDASDRLRALPESIDGKVVSVQWKTIDDEASGIADFVKSLLDHNYDLKDILILSPRRLWAYKIKEKFLKNELNVHSFFHEEAIESDLAQKSVNLLNLRVNRDDCVALRFWLGLGSKDYRAKQYKKLLGEANSKDISIQDLLDGIVSGNFNIKKVSHITKVYKKLLDELQKLEDKSVKEVIDTLFPEGHDDTKILREACLLLIEQDKDISIEAVWEHLETIITQPETPEHGNYIRIMSLHKAKGLTSKVTIIVNCIEGLIPRREKDNHREAQDLLKEQRRLFYVAMTRAKEYLVISSFKEINKSLAHKIGAEITNTRSKIVQTTASQFITETKIRTITGEQWHKNNFN